MGEARGLEGSKALLFRNCPCPPLLPLLRGPGSPNRPLLVVGRAARKGLEKELLWPGKGLESWKAGEGGRFGSWLVITSCEA